MNYNLKSRAVFQNFLNLSSNTDFLILILLQQFWKSDLIGI